MSDQITAPEGDPIDSQIAVVPVPNPIEDGGDETLQLMLKGLIAYKLAPIFAQWGVNLDPATLTVVILGLMHKAHKYLQGRPGFNWL